MDWQRIGRDLLAGAFALALPLYSVSDGDSGHALVQAALLLAGAALVFGELTELLDRIPD